VLLERSSENMGERDPRGCKRDEKGGIISDPVTEESSVPGVYVAGDASRDVLLIAVAIAEGAKAAVAINRALLREDGLA
jgi:thioredoxin reductase